MVKLKIDLSDSVQEDEPVQIVASETDKLKKLAAPLPSNSKSQVYALKEAPRVQLAFSNVPQPIKDAFVRKAKELKINQKDFLYQCLRAGGLDIPSAEEIDGRRR